MPLNLVPGTQLVIHGNKVYKLKLDLQPSIAAGAVAGEVENVLRVLLHDQGSTPSVQYIKTRHLLCDCTAKVWKAGKLLSFKKNGQALPCSGRVFVISAQLKIPIVQTASQRKQEDKQEINRDKVQSSKRPIKDTERVKQQTNQATTKGTPKKKKNHTEEVIKVSKQSLNSPSRHSARLAHNKDRDLETAFSAVVSDIEARNLAPEQHPPQIIQQQHTESHEVVRNQNRPNDTGMITRSGKRKCNMNFDKDNVKSSDKRKRGNSQTKDIMSSRSGANINNSSSKRMKLNAPVPKLPPTKRKIPATNAPAKCLNVEDQPQARHLANKREIDREEREEERKLESLVKGREELKGRGWVGKTWDFVLTPVKAVFRRSGEEKR